MDKYIAYLVYILPIVNINSRHKNIPVILAGDINGPEDSPVCERIFEEEFESAYKTIHGQEPKVTHKDHSENCAAVDFIFYR